MRDFHAKRWFLQLNLYNIIFVATFFIGVYQVVEGTLPLGFLLLLHWAYGRLWSITVYLIEFRVSLVEQRAVSNLVQSEFSAIFPNDPERENLRSIPKNWDQLKLIDASVEYVRPSGATQHIHIPRLTITRGDKIAISGPSGSGKTALPIY